MVRLECKSMRMIDRGAETEPRLSETGPGAPDVAMDLCLNAFET
jgi:hypothetical protein